MALAIDGTPNARYNDTTDNPVLLTLTTSLTHDIIIVDVETNVGPVQSVSGSTLGSFTSRNVQPVSGAPTFTLERWYKVAAAALAAETITIELVNNGFTTAVAYAVSGADTTTIWDATNSDNAVPSDPVSITTIHASTIILAAFRQASTASPTPGAGFTSLASANSGYFLAEYVLEPSADTYSGTIGTGVGDSNAAIIDSIFAASSGPGPVTPPTLYAPILNAAGFMGT